MREVEKSPVRAARSEGSKPRAERRQRVLLGGKLVFDMGERSADCLIRDLSPAGAHLRLRSEFAFVPHRDMWLIDVRGAAAYLLKLAWRKGSDLGVEFAERHELLGEVPSKISHLRRLWLECAER